MDLPPSESRTMIDLLFECHLFAFPSASVHLASLYNRGKNKIPIFGYFRLFKEYPQKSQIWKSETLVPITSILCTAVCVVIV